VSFTRGGLLDKSRAGKGSLPKIFSKPAGIDVTKKLYREKTEKRLTE